MKVPPEYMHLWMEDETTINDLWLNLKLAKRALRDRLHQMRKRGVSWSEIMSRLNLSSNGWSLNDWRVFNAVYLDVHDIREYGQPRGTINRPDWRGDDVADPRPTAPDRLEVPRR